MGANPQARESFVFKAGYRTRIAGPCGKARTSIRSPATAPHFRSDRFRPVATDAVLSHPLHLAQTTYRIRITWEALRMCIPFACGWGPGRIHVSTAANRPSNVAAESFSSVALRLLTEAEAAMARGRALLLRTHFRV